MNLRKILSYMKRGFTRYSCSSINQMVRILQLTKSLKLLRKQVKVTSYTLLKATSYTSCTLFLLLFDLKATGGLTTRWVQKPNQIQKICNKKIPNLNWSFNILLLFSEEWRPAFNNSRLFDRKNVFHWLSLLEGIHWCLNLKTRT